MIDTVSVFKDSLYTYYVTDSDTDKVCIPIRHTVGFWKIYASLKTQVDIFEDNVKTVVIIGYCVDSHGEIKREDIAMYLSSQNDLEFAGAISRFAGKFVIIKIQNENVEVYTDATASLPVFFLSEKKLYQNIFFRVFH